MNTNNSFESGRLERMREFTDELNNAGLYRSAVYEIVGKSLRESEGEPVQIRRAKAIAFLLDNVTLNVFPDEPIVGSMIGLWTLDDSLPCYDEQKAAAIKAIQDYLDKRANITVPKKRDNRHKPMEEAVTEGQARWALMSRVHHDASLNYTDYQKMLADMESFFADCDIKRYEIGKVLEATLRVQYNPEDREIMSCLPWLPGNHLGLDYEAVLVKGLAQMRDDINTYKSNTSDKDKLEFYTAVEIVINAMINFFSRYAQRVRSESESQAICSERKNELIQMADILEKMSLSPAQTFREALQAVWLLHIMSNIVGGSAMSFSRFDQYMLPFYEFDIENGTPREELFMLLCCFWLKVNEPKIRTVQSMTVGGVRPDGSDASSDLTRLCLEVAGNMKLPYPNIAARLSKSSPEWLYDLVIETINAGCGQPMILNDDVFIPNFEKLGYPKIYARDYFNMGCVELMIQGKQSFWGNGGGISYTQCFQQTLDAFTMGEFNPGTFDEFMDHFLDRLRLTIQSCHKDTMERKKSLENSYDPFCSILTQDCLARGKDINHNGSVCPAHWSIYAHGLGTLVDSLAAVKKFVYEDKRLTLNQLITALDSDFKGYEDIQVMLDRNTPCFGNDINDTDEIANRVFLELTKAIYDLNDLMEEDKYVATFFSYFTHVLAGEITKATPNGRHAGESLSDSMAPTQGKDVNGPTRMLNSLLKIDSSYVTGGYALNFKINPALTKDSRGKAAIKGLLKAYIVGMGPQIQIYFLDAEALREAQENPEKHRNLVVRVGGYCEYFVNLDKILQNEIIERTVHDAM